MTGSTGDSALYRAPTASASASVVLSDGTALEGLLHLHADASGPEGFETVQHLLDDRESFFALSLPSGEVALVRKSEAAEVRCQGHADEALPVAPEIRVELVLRHGARRPVRVHWGAPPPQRRALDLLNASSGFLRVTDQDGISYINTDHIRVAYPVE